MRDAAGEKESGQRTCARTNFGGSSVGEQFAAMHPGGRSEIDNAIGAGHEFLVVLDHEERVALRAERFERLDQAIVVAGVQSDARLVEHIQNAGEIGSKLGGQPDALGLAAGERVRRPIEG